MQREKDVRGDVTHFLNRASIDDLITIKDCELSRGPLLTRWRFVQMIDAELEGRKARNRKPR
jgi:hypothetical protein